MTTTGRFWLPYLALVALLLLCCSAKANDEHHSKTGEPPVSTSLPNMPPDNSGGRRAHMLYEGVIGVVTSEIWPESPAKAFAACFSVGLLKEAADYSKGQPGYRHGLFSRKDLLADAAGCGLGIGLDKGVRLMLTPRGAYLSVPL